LAKASGNCGQTSAVVSAKSSLKVAKSGGVTSTEESIGVFKWLSTAFEPTVRRIADAWSGDDPVQGYCDFLNHRMNLASERKKDVPDSEAFDSWLAYGFPGFD